MQKKEVALVVVLLVFTMISIASLFYRSIILEDFVIMENEKDGFELLEVDAITDDV